MTAILQAPDPLLAALRALAGVEKGGFHKIDQVLAKWMLARDPEQWSAWVRRRAWVMLGKYERQLQAVHRISWRRIPEPPAPEPLPYVCDDKRVWSTGAGWMISFPRDPEDELAVRLIDGVRWMKSAGAWFVSFSEPAWEEIQRVAALRGFTLAESATNTAAALQRKVAANVAASRRAVSDGRVEGMNPDLELAPYQVAGVEYLVSRRQTFLADEMGLGKTIETLAALHVLDAWPALVVCPATLIRNWQRETAKWLPQVRVATWPEAATITFLREEKRLHVVSYDMAPKLIDQLKGLKIAALVADEFHYCKGAKTKRTQAVRALARRVPVRFGLSGTPQVNRPSELAPQLGILGILDKLGGFWKFMERYCGAKAARHGWDMSGAQHLDELNERLRSVGYLRRLKRDVLTELPPKRRTVVEIDLDNREDYNKAQADVVAWIARGVAMKPTAAGEMLDPAERRRVFEEKMQQLDGMEMLVRFEALKQLAAKGKLARAMAWTRTFLEGGSKLVLFAYHREIVTALCEAFAGEFGAVSVMGGMGSRSGENVERFQADGDCRLLVANLTSGGVGHTMTAASHVAFLEQGWTPAAMDQAEDRVHRKGQQNAVNCYYLMAPGTIDWEIYRLIESKRAACEAAAGDTVSKEAQRAQIAQGVAAAMMEIL